jgi:hypothetical protein
MEPDGSDIVCLSFHETNEWNPSVDNDGKIVYTRWDYVDRGFNQAHHAWTTTPDGRDPRAVNGNFSPNQGARPHFEISMRAIPGSQKYMGTAACHHGQAYGSIILVDPLMPDDNAMAQVKRLEVDRFVNRQFEVSAAILLDRDGSEHHAGALLVAETNLRLVSDGCGFRQQLDHAQGGDFRQIRHRIDAVVNVDQADRAEIGDGLRIRRREGCPGLERLAHGGQVGNHGGHRACFDGNGVETRNRVIAIE